MSLQVLLDLAVAAVVVVVAAVAYRHNKTTITKAEAVAQVVVADVKDEEKKI